MSENMKLGHTKKAWPDSKVNHRIDGVCASQPTPTSAQSTQVHAKVLNEHTPRYSGKMKGGKKK